jgi:hypothetical protein
MCQAKVVSSLNASSHSFEGTSIESRPEHRLCCVEVLQAYFIIIFPLTQSEPLTASLNKQRMKQERMFPCILYDTKN